MTKKYDIPKSVRMIVIAEAADYARKKSYVNAAIASVSCGGITADRVIRFTFSISAIELGISEACLADGNACVEAMLSDLVNDRGFKYSASQKYYAEGTYKRRKNKAIFMIAKRLNLI